MSNYIRTLLRFEKERAARRAAGEETSESEDRTPEPQGEGEGAPARSGFWTTAPSASGESRGDEGPTTDAGRAGVGNRESEALPDLSIQVPADLPFEMPTGALDAELTPAEPPPEDKAPAKTAGEVQWWPEPATELSDGPGRKGLLGRLFSFLPARNRRRRQAEARASTHASTAYAQLLDSLRAVETSFSAPGVVLASAGSVRAVEPVLQGLRAQARRKGLRLLVAELVVSKGGRVLEGRDPTCTAELLEFNRTVTEDTVRNWFERAVTGQDLLIVEAPPLSQSVDAGLLARACDGLALVVEPQRTSHHEFETAVERAKASGSFLLGMVMSQHTHWLPHFLRTFFNSYPRLVRQPQRSRAR